ncbi:hypothetical protein [Jiulongibacter sp. NS-SX5]|uniref:hypothetical protein n=1 Tax=Jiulongibacter sp. NS-SX5 TaxID=3463854 RepID=UPI004057FD8A
MNKFLNQFTTSLLTLAVLFVGLSSCEKEETVVSDEVQLLSFGPTGVQPGENIRFIGLNLDKVLAVEMENATVESSSFISQSKEEIELQVPLTAEEGLIGLRTSDTLIMSKTVLSFGVTATISEIPATAKPGSVISIKGNYLNWVTSIWFGGDVEVTEFERQSINEIQVKVPMEALAGTVALEYGGTEFGTVSSETELEINLPSISSFGPNPADRDEDFVINGTDLDLVKAVVFKGSGEDTVFISQSESEIVLSIPAGANKGKIALLTFSGVTIESEQALSFIGDLPPLPDLGYTIYGDGFADSWQNWGWGSVADLASSDNARQGDASIKLDFSGSWGALNIANGSIATADYSELTFVVFGTEGTAGQTFNMTVNDGFSMSVEVAEGEWSEFKIPLADVDVENIEKITFQETGWSGTVFFDHIGLR